MTHDVQSVFCRTMDQVLAERAQERAERELFQQTCRSNFSCIWETFGAIDSKVRDLGLGSIREGDVAQPSFGHAIAYSFVRPECESYSIRFEFGRDASRMRMILGTGNNAPKCDISKDEVEEVEEVKSGIIKLAADFFV